MAAIVAGVDLLHSSQPDTSGKATPEPFTILATNDVWKHDIMRVDEDYTNGSQLTTRVAWAQGVFRVPDDYVSSPIVTIEWCTTKTTGDVVFDGDFRSVAGDGTESTDQAGTEASVTVTDSASATALRRMIATLTLTGLTLAAGEMVEFSLFQDGTDGADTLAGATIIHEAFFGYTNA